MIFAPLLWGCVCANVAGDSELACMYPPNHAVQLASGERILLDQQTRLIVECGTLAGTSPSTVVRLLIFHVSIGVDWFELGSAWAMTACKGLQ